MYAYKKRLHLKLTPRKALYYITKNVLGLSPSPSAICGHHLSLRMARSFLSTILCTKLLRITYVCVTRLFV